MNNPDLPQLPTTSPEWVPAAPFRAHVRHLVAATCLPWPAVAVAAGLSLTLVDHLLHGRRGRPIQRISPLVASALLILDSHRLSCAARSWVPAQHTRQTLLGLVGQGCDLEELSRFCGLSVAALTAIADGHSPGCRQSTAWLIDAAERLQLTGFSASAA